MNDILDTYAAADLLQVTRQTLAKWRLYGQGPRYIRLGRKIGYHRLDLDAWIDRRRAQSTSEYAQ